MTRQSELAQAQRAGDSILAYYDACFDRYGDTARGAGWPNEVDRQTRFDVVLDIVRASRLTNPVDLCDLGCGTGELFGRIRETSNSGIRYFGIDRSRQALARARCKFNTTRFIELDVLTASDRQLSAIICDYVVANGLFTVKGSLTQAEMWTFMTAVLERVWPLARRGMIFNVMSKAVDRERADLFHLSYDELARFLHRLAGRWIGFRADYGLYEYTAYALRQPPATDKGAV